LIRLVTDFLRVISKAEMLKSKIRLHNCKARFTFVLSNFTTMRDYKKHLTLLPHKWQTVGFVAAAIIAVCFVPFICLREKFMSQNWYMYLFMAGDLTLSIALLLICFSREKVEDEYIASARYRALTISVILFFVSRATAEMISGGFFLSNTVYDVIGRTVNESRLSFQNHHSFVAVIYKATYWLSNLYVLQLLYIVLLKLMVRLGNGNGFESMLFPYRYKKTGWRILIISAILIPLVVYYLGHVLVNNMGDVVSQPHDRKAFIRIYMTVSRLIVLLPYVGILLVCLSREQQEDEFIRHIRVRILAYFVIFYLIAVFIARQSVLAVSAIVTAHGGNYHPQLSYLILCSIGDILGKLTWVPLVAVVYELVLKRVLSNNLKESSNEE